MSKVKVTYYGVMFKIILGVDNQEEECQIPDGATVKELLRLLVEKHGDEFRAAFITHDWQLIPDTVILVNGNQLNINELDGLDTRLEDNSELSITAMLYTIDGG